MTDYISREAFIKWVEETYCKPCEADGRDYNHCRCGACQYDDMMRDAESFPTADVRYVARCQNCEMSKPCSDEREIYCTLNHCYKKKNWFCADGRDKNENPN